VGILSKDGADDRKNLQDGRLNQQITKISNPTLFLF